MEDILQGKLHGGDRLPGSRALSNGLGVARSTVVQTLEELVSEGWLRSHQGAGTFVEVRLPEHFAVGEKDETPKKSLGFSLPVTISRRQRARNSSQETLQMGGGVPDLRLLPAPELARAYRTALLRKPEIVLGYGDPRGEPALRRSISRLLTEHRGLAVDENSVVMTRGAQQALYLFAHAVLRPGDRVGVESLGYPPAWEAFESAGAVLVPLPLDENGLLTSELKRYLPLKAIYTTPHHQFPTLATLSAKRRLELLHFAALHQIAVVEDDYDHEIHFEGQPTRPLASTDSAGVVVYIGSLSKAFAPAARIGFMVAPTTLLGEVTSLRQIVDHQGDRVLENAMAELIDEELVSRHLRKITKTYRERRQLLLEMLEQELFDDVAAGVHRGGMTLWTKVLRVPARGFVSSLPGYCLAEGLQITAAKSLHVQQKELPFVRLGFAALDEYELREGVMRLKRGIEKWRANGGCPLRKSR
ncbi:MAG: PLP-dependent aminotransferase family protein [Deltaproteobacteria bacterium]|nr:PLP-dependent aminotransferase family protein [Deltaproteobacteria bacterium]